MMIVSRSKHSTNAFISIVLIFPLAIILISIESYCFVPCVRVIVRPFGPMNLNRPWNVVAGSSSFGLKASSSSSGGALDSFIQGDNTQKKKKESVAIIGGGIAGLSCANVLSKSGNYAQVTLFDTGRLRPGGRCASRFPKDTVKTKSTKTSILSNYVIDHAAQMIAVSPTTNKEFKTQLDQWEEQDIIQKFPTDAVCEIVHMEPKIKLTTNTNANANTTNNAMSYVVRPMNQNKTMYYHGRNGMGSIPLAMLEQCTGTNFQIRQDVWVSPDSGVHFVNDTNTNTNITSWKVQIRAKQKILGTFDELVIAHNGKCADRLMSKTPATEIHKLLRVVFAPTPAKEKMTLNSIYSLTFCIKKDKSPFADVLQQKNFVCAFIRNEPNLSLLSCQSRKYPIPNDKYEVWTVLSSANFAKKYKASQENLPPNVVESVTRYLLESVEKSLNLPSGSLASSCNDTTATTTTSDVILESKLQLWGAAVPLNTWQSSNKQRTGFLYDGLHGVGVCGDWLLDSSIAGAWESGRRLAEYMNNNIDSKELIGLNGKFQSSNDAVRAGIGSV